MGSGARVSEFFYNKSKTKKKTKTFLFFFFGGVGWGGGGGGEGARVSEFFLLFLHRIQI